MLVRSGGRLSNLGRGILRPNASGHRICRQMGQLLLNLSHSWMHSWPKTCLHLSRRTAYSCLPLRNSMNDLLILRSWNQSFLTERALTKRAESVGKAVKVSEHIEQNRSPAGRVCFGINVPRGTDRRPTATISQGAIVGSRFVEVRGVFLVRNVKRVGLVDYIDRKVAFLSVPGSRRSKSSSTFCWTNKAYWLLMFLC